jgi:hypothetical protein
MASGRSAERVAAAVDNNARWCDLVCRSQGIPCEWRSDVWIARRRTPPLYPDAITLRPGVPASEVLRGTDDGPGCAVKDSYADVELDGFDVLFEARWFYREPADGGPSPWRVVDTGDASVRRLVAEELGAEAMLNRTGDVVGVSNVSAPLEAWATLPLAAAAAFPSLPLVGYEHGEPLELARAAGFSEIGPLRVWLRA